MPEGDTIYRTAQRLQDALASHTVERFESVFPELLRVDRESPVAGRTVARAWSHGKHLLIGFSGGLVLRTHMRMHGSWHLYRPGERWRRPRHEMRITVHTPPFTAVAFMVPVAEFIRADDLDRHAVLRRLGPDVLADDFDPGRAVERLLTRAETGIGEALLDQQAIAGLGNVFKSEVCFAAGVNPFTPVTALGPGTLARVVETARRMALANVPPKDGRPSLWHGWRRTTGRLDPAERLFVYGRAGRPCRRCGTRIERRKQGVDARSTYWCPRCQPDT